MSTQNPEKYASWLRQSLAHDKKPLGFLLGAGCPAALTSPDGEPLIPGLAGLSKLVAEHAAENALSPAFLRLAENFRTDHQREANVEDLLTFCRTLRSAAGKGQVRDLSADDLNALDKLICSKVAAVVAKDLPDAANAYHHLAAWTGAIKRVHPIEIFTTNYDLLIEQALERFRVPYFDGFVGAHQSFFDAHSVDGDALPQRWARLWKIHGSINWRRTDRGGVFRSTSGFIGQMGNAGEECVIHPSHLKYDESRRMPYMALMDRLRFFFKQPNAFLVACGFSFTDQHINEILLEALQGNPSAAVFALFRRELHHYSMAVGLAARSANFTVLAADGAVIGGRRSVWDDQAQVSITNGLTASIGIGWVAAPVDPAKSPTSLMPPHSVPRLLLGDFAMFGNLLEELIGTHDRYDNVG